MSEITEKKKRGRRKKEEVPSEEVALTTEVKKRGRKPKGGKLSVKQVEAEDDSNAIVNVILHLKCSLNDLVESAAKTIGNGLTYNPEMPPEIETYNGYEIRGAFTEYEHNKHAQDSVYVAYSERSNICQTCSKEDVPKQDVNIKDVNAKLKQLKINLYKNTAG